MLYIINKNIKLLYNLIVYILFLIKFTNNLFCLNFSDTFESEIINKYNPKKSFPNYNSKSFIFEKIQDLQNIKLNESPYKYYENKISTENIINIFKVLKINITLENAKKYSEINLDPFAEVASLGNLTLEEGNVESVILVYIMIRYILRHLLTNDNYGEYENIFDNFLSNLQKIESNNGTVFTKDVIEDLLKCFKYFVYNFFFDNDFTYVFTLKNKENIVEYLKNLTYKNNNIYIFNENELNSLTEALKNEKNLHR